MARALNKLSVKGVTALKKAGRHADGGGLYFRITPAGARSWVFMTANGGKRIEIGLGAESAVSLASARKIAADMREAVAAGSNPRELLSRNLATPTDEITFGAFAEDYIACVEDGWRSEVHRKQWRQSLRDHAKLLADMPIDAIGTEEVLKVLRPIWLTKAETANRLRGRIEKILSAAKARGLRPIDASNPAQWRGHLDVLLPKPKKLVRGNHPALPWKDAPAFVADLRKRVALSARALEFVILTAARSGEVLGARWEEIDMAEALWTVPAARMKAGAEHVVPLSKAALALLRQVHLGDGAKGIIFAIGGAPRSNMAMAQLLKRMGKDNITVHGFRSTFRDWAGDATETPNELVEQALAHTISNKAERAYRRGKAIDRRRLLMQAWADFLQFPAARPAAEVA